MKNIRQEWLDWKGENPHRDPGPLTNTRSRFADFMFDNREQFSSIGDMTPVFESITAFLKQRKENET